MRVLTLTPFYPTASDDATGCFVAEPIAVLEKFGIESRVVAVEPFYYPRSTPNGHPARWVRYVALPGAVGLASAGASLYASLLAKMRKLHREWRIDLIHAHAALPCGHAAALLSRQLQVPLVVTIHGLDVFFARQVHGYAGRWCRRMAQSVYRSATRVVCISHKVKHALANGFVHADNISVIHNGVDADRFCPGQFSPESFTILSVGNLISIKGHALLLHAIATLGEHYPNLSCEIIGDGPERPHLLGLAERLRISHRVKFLGRQSRQRVADAMQRCTIFALPSRYEGLGCVYLEAMSAGKPAIACRGQGVEDIIQHGSNGWLIGPDDLYGLVDIISALLHDRGLCHQIGSAARQTILSAHTLAHQASQLAQLYRECAA
jgi:teichuronic acid biosynthesis glycosyltransferase TuaC